MKFWRKIKNLKKILQNTEENLLYFRKKCGINFCSKLRKFWKKVENLRKNFSKILGLIKISKQFCINFLANY